MVGVIEEGLNMIFFFWYDVLTLMMKPQGQILVFFVSYGLT